MKKHLLLILIWFVCCGRVWALDIVYPKKNPCTINAVSTFFIGSAAPSDVLKINDTEVKISPIGAFAQMVPLKTGVNNFKITSGADIVNFVIERPQHFALGATKTAPKLIEYPVMNNFYVQTENAPLRMTPVSSGINRLSHLPKNMQLLINGEKGDFYRVYLNSKLSGWIAKSNVEQREPKKVEKSQNERVKLIEIKTKEEKDYCLYEFELDRKTPFILKEQGEKEGGLNLQLFNIDGQEDSTYCLNVPMKKLIGYDAYYDKDKFILKVRKIPEINSEKPLKNITIAVDAGHGGTEFGAIGCCGDKEKDINLAIAKALKQELEKHGAKVVMTRVNDTNVSLEDRVEFAKDKNAALLISIHANAIPDGLDPIKNKGTSIYYYHNQAKALADSILSSMTTQLGTQNDKVRQGSLALVRPTSSISVLIEVAYIINPEDYALLLDKEFRSNCAKAITDGVEKYILELRN